MDVKPLQNRVRAPGIEMRGNSDLRRGNSATKARRGDMKQRILVFPERQPFRKFVTAVRKAGERFSRTCDDRGIHQAEATR